MTCVSIVIPTFRRPDGLTRLLESLKSDLANHEGVEIIVADNDANETARPIVEAFIETAQQKVIYRVAMEPGVSNARNVAMASVETRYVLFLDDDMEVVPPYLSPLLATSNTLGTTITFAASVAALPAAVAHLSEWLRPLYSRIFEGETRMVDRTLGTGGALVDLQEIVLLRPPFDPALNEVGGEDDAFFAHIVSQGGTVGWCAEAIAWEHVPLHRTTPSYLWARQFAYGQSPTRDAAEIGLRGIPSVIKWMGVGFVQSVLHAGLFIMMAATWQPSKIHHFGRMAQGVGKMFWWDRMSPRLYGKNTK